MRAERGFTLVEVVVAIGIFALLGLGCYKVVHGLAVARDSLTRSADEMRSLARAINLMNADFTQLTPRRITDSAGRQLAAVDTHDEYPIEFSRTGVPNPLMAKRARVVRVAYRYSKQIEFDDFRLDDSLPDPNAALKRAIGDGREGYLVRYTWPVLDRGREDKPQMQVVMSGVSDFTVEFMDDKQHWGDEWPVQGTQVPTATAVSDLPYAIRIHVETDKYGALDHVFQIRNLPPVQG